MIWEDIWSFHVAYINNYGTVSKYFLYIGMDIGIVMFKGDLPNWISYVSHICNVWEKIWKTIADLNGIRLHFKKLKYDS